ncbi:MAG: transposase [Phycisphaerales bacterium]
MPRTARVQPGGYVYHVINRGNSRMTIFDDDADYAAFERILTQTLDEAPMRLLGWCLMPNHWHLVLWPRHDGDLGRFMHRLTVRHVRRWHEHHHSVGGGHVYQGPYKSFVVQTDAHFLTVMRYVERNALRAGLVESAEQWRWGSLWRRVNSRVVVEDAPALSEGPVDRPGNWTRRVNQAETEQELEALRHCVRRGRPYGQTQWVRRTAQRLGLEWTIRPRGRPRKTPAAGPSKE